VQAVGLAFTLPWWTSLISGILDLLIGFWGATLGWDAEDHSDAAWVLYPLVPAAETVWTAFSLSWMFFQALNSIIHLQIKWSGRALVRPPGGNAYIGLFTMVTQMWAAKIRERWMARAVAWIVAAAVVASFALLTIPSVSTAPLYQLTSE